MNKLIYWSSIHVSEQMAAFLRCCEEMGYPLKERSNRGVLVFRPCRKADYLHVFREKDAWVIEAGNFSMARRGVACVLAGVECTETLPFDTFGIMLDCSRNKVFEPDFLKRYFLQYALLGCNRIMLYCEDTYVMPSEPFWGYMRGGYTMTDLKELDAWCSLIGIELSGCIQTLGHLASPLQWDFAYGKIQESSNVLLPGNNETYRLIRKMLEFWSKALKSRVIHIGMDEAFDLGRGVSFHQRPGVKPIALFNEHLTRVNKICQEFGYASPMIWSDMYFRLRSKKHYYYDTVKNLEKDVVSQIPSNIQLVYWDYYNKEREFYEKFIDIHRATGHETLLFSGIWTWGENWYNHAQTKATAQPAIEACLKKKLRQIYFTMWGDDGGVCCFRTALAGFSFCMEIACRSNDNARTAALFRVVTGEDYDLTLAISEIEELLVPDAFPELQPYELEVYGVSSMLLWDDPLYAINWRGLKALDSAVPERLQVRIKKILKRIPSTRCHGANDLNLIRALLRVLRLKYLVREKLEKAYLAGNRKAVETLLPYVNQWMKEMETYGVLFRNNWLGCARPFGLEVQQFRQAGQLQRIRELHQRISDYAHGHLNSIPELDASCGPAEKGYFRKKYHEIASGSSIQ